MSRLMRGGEIAALAGSRALHIWGSGHFGASLYHAMTRIQVEVAGFVDSNMAGQSFLGFGVRQPDEVLAMGRERVFILISPFLFTKEIAERCEASGFRAEEDYLTHAHIKPYHFEVDVSGRCNLRCITCPRGNMLAHRPEDARMSLPDYQKVLDKLLLENPLLSDIQLYSWGEPLLHPDLPEMIEYTTAKGLAVAVSSNLTIPHAVKRVMEARPTWFRVSLSGHDEETCSVIHRGGNWKSVRESLTRLSELRATLSPKTFVDVNYHLYKHNQEGVHVIRQVCRELGLVFRTNYAFLDPLDLIIGYAQGHPLPALASEGRSYLLLDIDQAIRESRESPDADCVSQNSFVIHSDLSFRRCTHIYSDERNLLASNFLDVALDDLIARANDCEMCRVCRGLGVHRFHFSYIDKGVDMGGESE